MKYKIVFSLRAEKDIEKSIEWYEEQQIGLGNSFIKMVDRSFNTISSNPESFQKQTNRFRQLPVNKFPYVIIYEITGKDIIRIIRIFHTSRNPKLKYRQK